MFQRNCAVILAAGEGKRMKWDRPKCLSPVLFKPMLQWVIDASRGAGIRDLCVVTGFRSEQVHAYLAANNPEVRSVLQTERKGTGHAVMTAAGFIRACSPGGNVLILNGDAPFLDEDSIGKALQQHTENGNAVTVISAILDDPTGYGRIIRAGEGGFLRAIVEQKDASTGELAVNEVNSGAFWFRTDALMNILPKIRNANAQGEYYLTDAVALLIAEGKRAGACPACSARAAKGANDCLQLHELNVIARDAVLAKLMRAGVDIPCADGVIVGPDVTIGRDCTVLPGTVLRGCTAVGSGCTLGPGTVLDSCTVGDGCTLDSVRASSFRFEGGARPLPFSSYGRNREMEQRHTTVEQTSENGICLNASTD